MSRAKKLFSLDRISVVHLNASRGYLTYVEDRGDGEYKVKGILLGNEESDDE